jgi:hypothetical protein
MVAMAALDAGWRPPSNYARARELQRSEKRLVERSKESNHWYERWPLIANCRLGLALQVRGDPADHPSP